MPLFGKSKKNSKETDEKQVPLLQTQTEEERIGKYIDAAAALGKQAHPKVAEFFETIKPCVICLMQVIVCVTPYIIWACQQLYEIYQYLPTNVLEMLFGAALCFFGGTYVASISAIEAARTMGGGKLMDDLSLVSTRAVEVWKANQLDDKIDANKDGIADVDQISPKELAQRKTMLVMTTVKNPKELQQAIIDLISLWIAVLATLRVQFARTTALALGIAECVEWAAVRLVAPFLVLALGPDLKHWVDTIISTCVKLIAVFFAWYIQMVISAFYSGLRGGRMFADGLLHFLEEHEIINNVPDCLIPKPYDPATTYLDEILMFGLAATGFMFQITTNFTLGFPLNIIFLPLNILEWILRYEITFG